MRSLIHRILAISTLGAAVACTPIVSAEDSDARAKRKIPVRAFWKKNSSKTTAGDITQVSGASTQNRVKRGPIAEQPGEVTSVEVRNEAGELIDGELGVDEYFYGAAPTPVKVGQPIPNFSSVPSRNAGMRLQANGIVDPNSNGTTYTDGGIASPGHSVGHSSEYGHHNHGGCEACEGAIQNGSVACDSCGHAPLTYHDERLETIARMLADPMAGFWVRAEYLQLWLTGQDTPALVTASPGGTPQADAGVLGLNTTTILYGQNEIGDEDRSAGRIEIGRYFAGESGLALSASYLFADDVNNSFSADSNNFQILARPFANVSPGAIGNNSELVAFDGELTGDISVRSQTSFETADVLLRGVLICEKDRQMEGFAGYTFMSLDDDILIQDSKRVIGGAGGVTLGTTVEESDQFTTDNDFHGAAVGVRSQTCYGGWSIATMLKLGLGSTRSRLRAIGSTTTSVPLVAGGNDVQTRNTGLLVQDSNRGSRSFDQFSVAPEIRLLLSRRMNRDWSMSVGYHLLYLSRVMRAGEQIDPLINITQLDPGGLQGLARPQAEGVFNDMTAQAITFGLLREF